MSDQSTPKLRKLLNQIRDAIRLKHYSYSTEKTYVHWAKRYILFYHNKYHPAETNMPKGLNLKAPSSSGKRFFI